MEVFLANYPVFVECQQVYACHVDRTQWFICPHYHLHEHTISLGIDSCAPKQYAQVAHGFVTLTKSSIRLVLEESVWCILEMAATSILKQLFMMRYLSRVKYIASISRIGRRTAGVRETLHHAL